MAAEPRPRKLLLRQIADAIVVSAASFGLRLKSRREASSTSAYGFYRPNRHETPPPAATLKRSLSRASRKAQVRFRKFEVKIRGEGEQRIVRVWCLSSRMEILVSGSALLVSGSPIFRVLS